MRISKERLRETIQEAVADSGVAFCNKMAEEETSELAAEVTDAVHSFLTDLGEDSFEEEEEPE